MHIETVQSRSSLYQWEIDPHVHRGLYQVLFLRGGGVDCVLDEWRGRLRGPVAIVAPPGVVHGFRFEVGADGFVLTLSPRFLVESDGGHAVEAFRQLFLSPGLVELGEGGEAARIAALLHELAQEFAMPESSAAPTVAWLARAALWRLAMARAGEARHESGGGKHQGLFSRFLLLVEEHFLQHWPLRRYGAALGLSTARLNRLARLESGRSGLALIHDRVTREACRKLIYTSASAEQVASELGFADPAYFSRFFKRRMGQSPHQWRTSSQARREIFARRGASGVTPSI